MLSAKVKGTWQRDYNEESGDGEIVLDYLGRGDNTIVRGPIRGSREGQGDVMMEAEVEMS